MVWAGNYDTSRALDLCRLGTLALALAACSDFGSAEPTPTAGSERQAVSPTAPPGSQWGAEFELLAPDGTRDDSFGGPVVVEGDTILVGAPIVGAVYVFEREVDRWTFSQRLEEPVAQSYSMFGSSLALEGDTALVGAPGGNSQPGSVYVFERAGGSFILSQTLVPSVTSPPQEFGNSVDLEGDLVAVGAWNQSIYFMGVGTDLESAAYVFERSGGTFREIQRLVATDDDAHFGQTVDLSGNTLLVTAPWRTGTVHQGTAYFYVRSGATFQLQQPIDGEQLGFLGSGAALEGDRALVADFGSHVVEVVRSAGVWSMGPEVGYGAIALQGDRALLGHAGEDGAVMRQGAVHVVERSGGAWSETAVVTASEGQAEDYFGGAVALDRNTMVVSATGRDGAVPNRGAAYVYRYGLALGERCSSADDCLSARCVDGRCCDGDCAGPCGACSVAAGAEENGRCTLFPRGDPGSPSCGTLACTGDGSDCERCRADADCPSDRYCSADGRCEIRKQAGEACDLGAGRDCEVSGCRACTTEHCTDGVCCDRTCDGQCEACAESGSEGECVTVEGEPRGEREPCDPNGDPDCRARCDGSEPSTCSYVSASVECGRSCDDDREVVATCDGQGRCVEGESAPCAPYVCAGDACLTGCETDADCRDAHRCSEGECVPAVARCSADGSEAIAGDGTSIPCFPYKCEESSGTCRADCDATSECAAGRVCDPDKKHCVEPPDDATDDGGCGCRTPGDRPRRSVPLVWLAAAALLAARVRAGSRFRSRPRSVL